MIIGSDIDGVLTDLEKYQLVEGEKFYKRPPVNKNGYKTWQIFGGTLRDDEDFWAKNIFDYAENYPIKKDAAYVIEKLKNDGHKIIFVTARTYAYADDNLGVKMRKTLCNWLDKNGVLYDKIVFSTEDKEETCMQLKLDLMIEDSPMNVEYLKKRMPVICMEAGYNLDVKGDNVYRCKDWSKVYETVNKIAKKDK